MLVVHIGLGKTASTTLQKHVFPLLTTVDRGIAYNNQLALTLCRKFHLFGLDHNEQRTLRGLLTNGNVFLSSEGLVNWDPWQWEAKAERNLALFGREARIVITVREPESYLRSLYQQTVHEGRTKTPQEFFVSHDFYTHISPYIRKNCLEYYDAEAFNLERLHQIYLQRFDKVYFIPMAMISQFQFLQEPFDIAEKDIVRLRNMFDSVAHENVAYSNLAMKMTFGRERLLRALGVSMVSTDHLHLQRLYRTYFESQDNKAAIHYRELAFSDKLKEMPSRGFRKIAKRFRWRNLMQNVVNKYLPFSSYSLPELEHVKPEMLEANRRYLESLEGKQ